MIRLANQIDSDLCALYDDVFMHGGSAGTTPSTFAAVGSAAQKLDEGSVPQERRKLVLNPAATWGLADGLKGLYVEDMVKGMVKNGKIGRLAVNEEGGPLVHMCQKCDTR